MSTPEVRASVGRGHDERGGEEDDVRAKDARADHQIHFS